MKKYLIVLFLLFSFTSFSAYSQHYDIGIHGGVFTPIDFWYYVDGEVGASTGIKFNYHFNEKLSLSSNYLHGKFHFSPAGAEERINGQRFGKEKSRVSFNAVSFIFLRKFKLKNKWEFHAGTGIGYFLEHWEGEKNYLSGKKDFKRDFTMPLELNLNKPLNDQIIIGIKTGAFLTPFYTFGGFHVGPEFSFRF
ncbi:hypothetical protein [Belliella pelovolcani]|uniref:Outer membrane protein beta-barrel domain-containing protein n=1 Tax=Belliella pelovolcani TaxID=529505 RepID=A0A1N7M7A5_9BACT|nr:hypothetical protein [Belliella pelovolcani]SIS81964.1 hypothetical protein SAMN05421761_105162 [Belliella pelovolcani]